MWGYKERLLGSDGEGLGVTLINTLVEVGCPLENEWQSFRTKKRQFSGTEKRVSRMPACRAAQNCS
jgi:hypothetical protein